MSRGCTCVWALGLAPSIEWSFLPRVVRREWVCTKCVFFRLVEGGELSRKLGGVSPFVKEDQMY
uniref:Uncharacterized protein n=1 Tax=Setaria italica TaxID=4555 RepID=K3XP33_SETIT